jgi:hypothetical protein
MSSHTFRPIHYRVFIEHEPPEIPLVLSNEKTVHRPVLRMLDQPSINVVMADHVASGVFFGHEVAQVSLACEDQLSYLTRQ